MGGCRAREGEVKSLYKDLRHPGKLLRGKGRKISGSE
jgi:hypothetical protein